MPTLILFMLPGTPLLQTATVPAILCFRVGGEMTTHPVGPHALGIQQVIYLRDRPNAHLICMMLLHTEYDILILY